jgi:MoaA/NifB/PqqE/SkfB family radical SAM enzyme
MQKFTLISLINSQIKPRGIRLEAATVCQLKCPSCETAQGITHEKLGSGFLKLKDFEKLVDENTWVSTIELSNWGEIFLNPDLSDIIQYAYENNVALRASNGVNLNTVKEKILEDLVKYKFRHLTCSIDGASSETYSIYRQGGNFEKVIQNIKKINHYKALYRSEFPILTWQFVVFGHNEHEIDTMQLIAKDLNMNVRLKLSWDEKFSSIKNEELVRKKIKLGVASRSEYLEKYGVTYLQKRICSQLWKNPQINWDGKILGCCYNYWGDFGNAFESGLKDGLNNEKISYARQMLCGKVEAKEGIPCTTCGHYRKMKENEKWLTIDDVASFPLRRHNLIHILGRLGVWMTNKSSLISKIYLRLFRGYYQ